ncbi:long-chain fatty acid--CoA ligase [Bradyrhizobium sp. INPA01-394B]|uniref:Long-chain fatty acid--CoA ligase n=1 Tax=Bradyrhizobium campsiandrae TaxID=1729892 RepID=A0ABR7UGR0_9BRAD|nr:long-chain fatty acid--CoA ligase [Bradyrhizobium campsiandrae]MBC9883716.1 long-chain fatty acid--CoA ligase [Bradyrhizobium campsiandrae]MBC9982776.1 long-chain fatty acid--CoA ligase [Bradyrhizobium campsiandrae]
MLGQMMRMPLTIHSLIAHGARYHGDTEIVSIETDGTTRRSNWRTVSERSRQLSSALGRMGIVRGDRCATIAWNNARHLECYFGISCGGMVCHTINPRLFPEQLIYIINHAEDRVVFFDKTFLPIIAKLREHLKSVEAFVLLSGRDEEAAAQVPGLLFYEDFIATGDVDADWGEVSENDASSLCYTSGTTGNPKGVLYSHRSTVLHSLAAALPDTLNISAREVIMPVVPMFHVNAWGVPYAAAMVGAKLVLPGPGLDGESLARLIDAEGVTMALGVPTIWQGLLAALKKRGSKAETLKRTIVGGSACPPSMIAEFRDKYGTEVVHAWGMTETSPLGTANALLERHGKLSEAEQAKIRESQGRPPYGVELKIVDDEGNRLPEDGVAQGNLRIRGHWVVADYFGFEAGETLEEDGWFETGDVASINAEGFMTIRDRSKDIIKSGGEWISTVELEGIAVGHPGVADAAAIAARHEKWDERPILLAVKAPGADVTEEELIAYYADKVAKWQIPDKVIFVDQLPRNATGKVLKNKLREEYGGVLTGA